MIPQPLSITEQLAKILREGIHSGRWRGILPGRTKLTQDLGASPTTLTRALHLLEKEGLLESQGAGRRRRILLRTPLRRSTLRVTILPNSMGSKQCPGISELRNRLALKGYDVDFSPKGLQDLGMDLTRIIQFVGETDVDAWVVQFGPKPIMEWFAAQETPAFGFSGGLNGVNIAGTGFDGAAAIRLVTRRLIGLGHKRIVYISLEYVMAPKLGLPEETFLNEMAAHGISTGPYNCPIWGSKPDELARCLDMLFKHTPPTALIVSTVAMLITVKSFLLEKRLRIPGDVSVFCTSGYATSDWESPHIAHLKADPIKMVKPALDWIEKVAVGESDRKQTFFPMEFDEGESIGPPPSMKKH